MEKSDSITSLATALSAFQGELKPAIKSEENPFFHARYADLASVYEAVREPLAKHGLSVTQTLGNDPIKSDILIVETTLMHKSGEWLSSKWCMPVPVRTTVKKDNRGEVISTTEILNDPKAVGCVVSYARRYSLSAILGVAADDDDAEKVTDHEKVKAEAPGAKTTGAAKEHWCAEHNTAYFMSGKMKSFAHPIKGTEPAQWCYEHKKEVAKPVIKPPSPENMEQSDEIYGEEVKPPVKTTAKSPLITAPMLAKINGDAKKMGYQPPGLSALVKSAYGLDDLHGLTVEQGQGLLGMISRGERAPDKE